MKYLLFNDEIDEKEIFSSIISYSERKQEGWLDIIDRFSSFLKENHIKDTFFLNDLSLLKKFNFNCDYIDYYGNNLLFSLINERRDLSKFFYSYDNHFFNEKNISFINKHNNNILFYLCRNISIIKEDINHENSIIKTIENYNINIHQFNSVNNNIFNIILTHHNNLSFSESLINYLLDKNVSISHLNKDNYSLLNYFNTIQYNHKNKELFLYLLDFCDIDNQTKYKDTLISNLFDILLSNKSTNKSNAIKWLDLITENITNLKFENINYINNLIVKYEPIKNNTIKKYLCKLEEFYLSSTIKNDVKNKKIIKL